MISEVQFAEHVFREYDIRGIAGVDIHEPLAERLGRAFAHMLPPQDSAPVVVGRDVRLSGPSLQHALIQGLLASGRDVLDIGVSPSPLAYFAVHQLHASGCIHITASHNPSEYNGFKLMKGKESLHGHDIQQLMHWVKNPPPPTSSMPGQLTRLNPVDVYMDFVAGDCPLKRPLRVVIDAGNGPSGVIAAPLYRRLGCEVIELFCEPDGHFPNHHPDPTIESNLHSLKQQVREHHADLGIAFDGDGDRIGLVDEQGAIIWGDMLLLLLARRLLQTHPGATIISEVKASQYLYDEIKRLGGHGMMWRTGHSPIKAKMKETGALLAGEMSGHIFFADRFPGYDDAIYAGARIMQLLSEQPQPLSSLLADVPHALYTPEIRINCPDSRKFLMIEEARKHFAELGLSMIDIDGVRIQFADGWGLLRASNTQPALVMRYQAPNEQRLDEMRKIIESWLHEHL